MPNREYVVIAGRGRLKVKVFQHYIDTYGERAAVATAAWNALMANDITKDVLLTEINSLPEARRIFVYQQFENTINYQWVGVIHG